MATQKKAVTKAAPKAAPKQDVNPLVAFFNEALKTTSRCAALRATATQFIDTPRAEFTKTFVELGMKHTTVGANFQAARRAINTGVEHPARKSAKAPAAAPAPAANGVHAAFEKLNARKGKRANGVLKQSMGSVVAQEQLQKLVDAAIPATKPAAKKAVAKKASKK